MAASIRRRWPGRWLAVLLSLSLAGPVAAADGIIRISSDLFDKYAASLQPLTYAHDGWYNVQVPTFFGPVTVPIYCSITATVSNVHLSIVPGNAVMSASVTGTMCGFNHSSSVVSGVAISIDAGTGGLLVRPVGQMNINATVTVLGVPLTVALSDARLVPGMTVLSIPLDMVKIQIESPSGPRTLALVARNQQLSLQNGYLEIQADAYLR